MLTNISIESFWHADYKNSIFEKPRSKQTMKKIKLKKIFNLHTLYSYNFPSYN